MQNDIVRRPVVRPKARKPQDTAAGKENNQHELTDERIEEEVREAENVPSPAETQQQPASAEQENVSSHEPASDQGQQEESGNGGHWGVISAAVFVFIMLAGLAVYANLSADSEGDRKPQPSSVNQPTSETVNDSALSNPAAESSSGINVQP